MLPNWNGRPPPRPLNSAESMLAACLAGIATLLLAPLIANVSDDLVMRLAERSYGYGSDGAALVSTLYRLLVWPTTFFALKISIQAALLAGVVAAAIRFI